MTVRPIVAALLASACLIDNPAYESSAAHVPATADTTTGTGTTAAVSTSNTSSTSSTTDPGPTTGSPTASTSDDTSSTGATTGAPQWPMTLKNYETAACDQGLYCANGMGDAFPAAIRAFECFRVDTDQPFLLTRVGFEVRLVVGQPTAVVEVLPYDSDAGLPILTPIASVILGVIDEPMTYHDFPIDPPVLVETPDFCISVAGGDPTSTSLSLRTDPHTMTPGDAFFTMDNDTGVCDVLLTNLKDHYKAPFAHYCIDADITPP